MDFSLIKYTTQRVSERTDIKNLTKENVTQSIYKKKQKTNKCVHLVDKLDSKRIFWQLWGTITNDYTDYIKRLFTTASA